MLPDRNQLLRTETLLSGWSKVVRLAYVQTSRNGEATVQDRDLLDRGHGITVLLYDDTRDLVLLLRQPRIIATVHGFDGGETVEACNGLMESADPVACAMRELEEETGHRPQQLERVGTFYASPGSSLELVHIFLARYGDDTRVSAGGGNSHEGEDIELFELPLSEAAAWLADGRLKDARTAIALQALLLRRR